MMNEPGKSDRLPVPAKFSNNVRRKASGMVLYSTLLLTIPSTTYCTWKPTMNSNVPLESPARVR